MQDFDSIIVGGGISGLTAAYLRKQRGDRVLLIEPDEPAGLVRSVQLSGFTLELGAATLVENPELVALLEDLGLSDRLRRPAIERYQQCVWFRGKIENVPRSPLRMLFSSPLIAAHARMKILRAVFWGEDCRALEDESVATFFGRIAGASTTANILDPVLSGIYGGDVGKLSARSVFPKLWESRRAGHSLIRYLRSRRAAGRKQIFMLAGGNDAIVRALISRLGPEIRRDRVKSLTAKAEGFKLTLESGELVTGKRVYLATAGAATASYLTDLDSNAAQLIHGIPQVPLVVVHGSVPRSQPLPREAFGILFPSSVRARLLGVMFNSIIFPHLAPPDRHLLTLCLGGAAFSEVINWDESRIRAVVQDELRKRLNVNQFNFLSVHRWPRAIPQYNLGHFRIADQMDRLAEQYPGLHFIGADRGGVGVGDRVRQVYETCS